VRNLAILFVVVFLVVVGGGLTVLLNENADRQPGQVPLGVVQSADPEASVFVATDWQAQQLFLLVGFLVFNLIGIGVTLALIFWFLSRQVANVRAAPTESKDDKGIVQS
jgi:hypothetical protein